MKSRLINYTDKAFKKLLIEEILRINPLLRMGEDVTAPMTYVRDGRVVTDEDETPRVKTIQLDRVPQDIEVPKLQPPVRVLTANQPLKVSMKAIEERSFESLDFKLLHPKFFHFYRIDTPHRSWLEEYDVGDNAFINHMDVETFTPIATPITLTQEIMDEHSYVNIYFALSTRY